MSDPIQAFLSVVGNPVDGVPVQVPERTAQALTQAGWTPPCTKSDVECVQAAADRLEQYLAGRR